MKMLSCKYLPLCSYKPKLPNTSSLNGFALLLFIGLSGCGGSTNSNSPSPSLTNTQSTTLGTRETLSQPVTRVSSNESSVWTKYNRDEQFPKLVNLPAQFITMDNGTRLAAYVTLPADSEGNAVTTPLPTILIQTGYNGGFTGKAVTIFGGADPYLVKRGYATVVVDSVGTGQSSGTWSIFGPEEQAGYAAAVNWVTEQSFSDGRIGLFGFSYLGITAMHTAGQRHPSVKTAFIGVPIGDVYRDLAFTGGQVNVTFLPLFLGIVSSLGIVNTTALTNPAIGIPTILDHINGTVTEQVPLLVKGLAGAEDVVYDGDYWKVRSPSESVSKINIPTFLVGSLQDLFQRSTPMLYEAIKQNATAKLLIMPGQHFQASFGFGLPADNVPVFNEIALRWFDQYLKEMNVGADTIPNVTQYVTGFEHFVTSTDWPHPRASAQRLYFQPNKNLSISLPKVSSSFQTMQQQPLDGLCSVSSAQWTGGILGLIPTPCTTDNRIADSFSISYQTAPMEKDYYINGPIQADIWMATTASDASLSVRVSDVSPSGAVVPISNGLQAASFRKVDESRSRKLNGQSIQPWHPFTLDSVLPVTPREPILVPVEIFTTSAVVAKGHSLRVSVGPSNLPQGTFSLPKLLKDSLGIITIYNDIERPSSIVLPIVPTSELF